MKVGKLGVGKGMNVMRPFNCTQTPNARDIDRSMTLKIYFNPIQKPIGLQHQKCRNIRKDRKFRNNKVARKIKDNKKKSKKTRKIATWRRVRRRKAD